MVFVGYTSARVLGFLFAVAAGRLLPAAEFGRLTYAMTVVTIAAALLSSSPIGLARFLAIYHADPREQESYLTNWIFVVGVLLLVSLAATPVVGLVSGLDLPLLMALAVNLAGVAVFETYREVQRGLDRYFLMAVYYVLANLLQLVVIVVLGGVGVRSAPVYLTVYGLSSLAGLLLMEVLRPTSLHLGPGLIARRYVLEVLRYVRPRLLQSVFYVVWFGADLVAVQHLLDPIATGNYGAAKTLAMVLVMPTTALGTALMPRVARFSHQRFRAYILRVPVVTAAVTLPFAVLVALLREPLVGITFGSKYAHAADALPVLALGMALYGFHQVLGSLWVGRGRTSIDLLSTSVAMVVTVTSVFWLVPRMGLVGAGAAFAAGAAARLGVMAVYTIVELRQPGDGGDPPGSG